MGHASSLPWQSVELGFGLESRGNPKAMSARKIAHLLREGIQNQTAYLKRVFASWQRF